MEDGFIRSRAVGYPQRHSFQIIWRHYTVGYALEHDHRFQLYSTIDILAMHRVLSIVRVEGNCFNVIMCTTDKPGRRFALDISVCWQVWENIRNLRGPHVSAKSFNVLFQKFICLVPVFDFYKWKRPTAVRSISRGGDCYAVTLCITLNRHSLLGARTN